MVEDLPVRSEQNWFLDALRERLVQSIGYFEHLNLPNPNPTKEIDLTLINQVSIRGGMITLKST